MARRGHTHFDLMPMVGCSACKAERDARVVAPVTLIDVHQVCAEHRGRHLARDRYPLLADAATDDVSVAGVDEWRLEALRALDEIDRLNRLAARQGAILGEVRAWLADATNGLT